MYQLNTDKIATLILPDFDDDGFYTVLLMDSLPFKLNDIIKMLTFMVARKNDKDTITTKKRTFVHLWLTNRHKNAHWMRM